MKRLVAAAGAAVLVLSLAACGDDDHNTDPRKGLVTIDKSSCLWGGCYDFWKVCSGPDLIVHTDRNRRYKNAEECKP